MEKMTVELLNNLDKASMPGCQRRRYQVDVDVARAAAGAAHGEGAEHEFKRIV
jgi:hypothetical protein